jgi:hypothetical protein
MGRGNRLHLIGAGLLVSRDIKLLQWPRQALSFTSTSHEISPCHTESNPDLEPVPGSMGANDGRRALSPLLSLQSVRLRYLSNDKPRGSRGSECSWRKPVRSVLSAIGRTSHDSRLSRDGIPSHLTRIPADRSRGGLLVGIRLCYGLWLRFGKLWFRLGKETLARQSRLSIN